MNHRIENFLDEFESLTPSDAQVGDVATSEWWTPLKTQFDDLLWMYFGQRLVFINNRFPFDDKNKAFTNIVKTFAILLKSKKPQLDKIYDVITAEYNPIWNVDGVTGTISKDTHTGTDVNAKSGNDANVTSGNDITRQTGQDTNTQGGRDVDTLSGSDMSQASGTDTRTDNITRDETTRTGSVGVNSGGTDINSHGVFTFDDTSNSKPSAIDSTEYGKTDTTTYNNLKDSHLSNETDSTQYGRKDTTSYGKIDTTVYGKTDTMAYGKTDTTTYGKTDTMNYNSSNTETRNLLDEHIDLVIRQGNQGVTMTQAMINEELSLRDKFDFFYYVVHMCVNQVSYGVEGV